MGTDSADGIHKTHLINKHYFSYCNSLLPIVTKAKYKIHDAKSYFFRYIHISLYIPPKQQSEIIKQDWIQAVHQHISRYKKHSKSSHDSNIKRRVMVYFIIDNNGNIHDLKIDKSSGNAHTDQAALGIIKRSAPLPKPPKDILINNQVSIIAPIYFDFKEVKTSK